MPLCRRPILIAFSFLALSLTPAPASARPASGDAAPALSLQSSTGKIVTLSEFKGKKTVVLAFFPKAFTFGWTRETAAYRDSIAKFADASAQVLGISTDDVETLRRFAESQKLPYPLLSDPEGAVALAYGVLDGKRASRATFVIGADGKVIKVIEGLAAISPSSALDACRLPKKG